MSNKPVPPFHSEILPPGGQLAADTFIAVVGELSQRQDVSVSYADVMAGLIYATPVILSLADDDEAIRRMVRKFRDYVGAEYFPTLVMQWSVFMKEMMEYEAEHNEGDANDPLINTDLSTDPRFN